MSPPDVVCMTKLWHPNISVDGDICLSLLRPHSLDGMGWAPTRYKSLKMWQLQDPLSRGGRFWSYFWGKQQQILRNLDGLLDTESWQNANDRWFSCPFLVNMCNLSIFNFFIQFIYFCCRRVKDVVWGLNSLFSDLTNFDDPLNIEAADHFRNDREGFRIKVRDWVTNYAKR